ncbi:hypothetical protein Tdes44962_MAKER03147 [Teratosphaeria destructans]|uniref:Uncharacterized protein n=1 Tax=Teratosphaeria destructans TaxID=418781 RepID=A0A9W7SR75_9PEZI|nr:hypothetical protein Tdes44962_MAKER03147 [Teratosphaeria destructans]
METGQKLHEDLLERLDADNEANEELREKLQMLQVENEGLEQRVKANDKIMEKLQLMEQQELVNTSLREELERANDRLQDLHVLEQAQAGLQQELDKKQALIAGRDDQIKEFMAMRKRANARMQELAKLKQKQVGLDNELSAIRKRDDELKEAQAGLQQELIQKQALISGQDAQIVEFKAMRKRANGRMQQLAKLKQKQVGLENDILRKEDELSTMRQQDHDRLAGLSQLKGVQGRLDRDIIEKDGLIRDQVFQINELSTKRQHADHDAQVLAKLDSLAMKLDAAYERHDRDHDALEELRQKLDATQAQLEAPSIVALDMAVSPHLPSARDDSSGVIVSDIPSSIPTQHDPRFRQIVSFLQHKHHLASSWPENQENVEEVLDVGQRVVDRHVRDAEEEVLVRKRKVDALVRELERRGMIEKES